MEMTREYISLTFDPSDMLSLQMGFISNRGLTGRFLLLRNFSVTISVSPNVCFILV